MFVHIVHTLLIFPCERFFGGKIQNVSTDTGFVVSGLKVWALVDGEI